MTFNLGSKTHKEYLTMKREQSKSHLVDPNNKTLSGEKEVDQVRFGKTESLEKLETKQLIEIAEQEIAASEK